MHETIARLNIQHFRKELAEVSDQPAERDLDALVVGRRRKLFVVSSEKEKKQA
jgi:hypothetical protein